MEGFRKHSVWWLLFVGHTFQTFKTTVQPSERQQWWWVIEDLYTVTKKSDKWRHIPPPFILSGWNELYHTPVHALISTAKRERINHVAANELSSLKKGKSIISLARAKTLLIQVHQGHKVTWSQRDCRETLSWGISGLLFLVKTLEMSTQDLNLGWVRPPEAGSLVPVSGRISVRLSCSTCLLKFQCKDPAWPTNKGRLCVQGLGNRQATKPVKWQEMAWRPVTPL